MFRFGGSLVVSMRQSEGWDKFLTPRPDQKLLLAHCIQKMVTSLFFMYLAAV